MQSRDDERGLTAQEQGLIEANRLQRRLNELCPVPGDPPYRLPESVPLVRIRKTRGADWPKRLLHKLNECLHRANKEYLMADGEIIRKFWPEH